MHKNYHCGVTFESVEIDSETWGQFSNLILPALRKRQEKVQARQERDKLIVELVKNGLRKYMVAQQVGCSTTTVQNVCRANGV